MNFFTNIKIFSRAGFAPPFGNTIGHSQRAGFTLVELMVTVTVFTIVMLSALGSLLAIVESNRKAQALKLAINNLNFSIEKMSRDIRTGGAYYCGLSAGPSDTLDCPDGRPSFSFTDHFSRRIQYDLDGTQLKISVAGAAFEPFISPLVAIEEINFYVSGSLDTDNVQPTVIIALSGYAGVGKSRSNFAIQTTVVKRLTDKPL